MQINRKKIWFHWGRMFIFFLIVMLIEIVNWIPMGNKEKQIEVKAAYLESEEYRITYHSNGGSGDMPDSFLSAMGGNLSDNTFTRTGYTFTGWSVSAEGNVIYKNGFAIQPVKDMDLYAVWEVNKYSVTLENTGEESNSFLSAVAYGSNVRIEAGKKEGYTFEGWTVDSMEVLLEDASNPVTTFFMPDKNVCLHANWSINSYQVTVTEGGEESTEILTVPYQSTVTIQAGTKEGYTFDRWEVESGTVQLADASNPTTSFVIEASDVKIKAIWRVNQYKITIKEEIEGILEQQSFHYGETITLQAGKKTGFYFLGWEIAEEGNIVLEDPTSQEISFVMPASDLVIDKVWKKIADIQVAFHSDFYNTYHQIEYYKDGCYNINKKITITQEMLEVVIQFLDGTSTLAKKEDYLIEDAEIQKLGENRVKVILIAGDSGLSSTISMIGYSPELDAVMQSLGLSKDDYRGLAAKVEQMQTEIKELYTKIAEYQQNIFAIKELLTEAGVNTDLTGELEEQLKKIQDSVKAAVDSIKEKEEELKKIKEAIYSIIEILGIENESFQDYENLSEILKELQKEIETIKNHETIIIQEINQIAEKLGIKDSISNMDSFEESDFFEIMKEKIEYQNNQLELYEKAVDQLKNHFTIANAGSLKSQLDEILGKVKQTQVYLEDLKNEIENQLKVSYIEVDTKEMEQLEAIFSRIYALKAYANRFYQFYNTLKELLGIDITGTEKDLYQAIAKLKDKVTEYDRYLEQVKGLIWQDGENESGSLETGEQTKEELDKVYIRTEEIINQLEILKEIFQIVWEKEEISIEDKEELKSLLERLEQIKQQAEGFINRLKSLLEMDSKASEKEVYQKISAMKDTMIEYWNYLSKIEYLIQIEDGSGAVSGSAIVTGPAVTTRLTTIYDELDTIVKQQKNMSETIEQLLKEGQISSEMIHTLKKLQEELLEQKQQADQLLEELKKQLAEQGKESEEVEKIIVLLEQKIQKLSVKNQESELENEKLKTEIKKLKQELNSDSSGSHSSNLSFSLSEQNFLERENQLQKEKIVELEKQIQTQIKEKENLLSERKQLLESITEKDKQIEDGKAQIETLLKQLTEKENKIKDLETILQKQKPMQELLEKNQIYYEQLVSILKNKDKENTVQIVKENLFTKEEAVKEETLEESVIQKEKKETQKTATAETEIEETSLEESTKKEELESREEQKIEDKEKAEDKKQEKKINFYLIILVILFILIGAVVFVFCGTFFK